jgi:hypothetical protein
MAWRCDSSSPDSARNSIAKLRVLVTSVTDEAHQNISRYKADATLPLADI